MEDERAATTAPSEPPEPMIAESDEPRAAKSAPASGTLTIAQAKEKLRARRIKSRKRIDQLQQELELYQQQHKKMETSTVAPTTSTPSQSLWITAE